MPSTSKKQHNFMAAIANNPSFAKKVGVSQSVGKDFNAADKGKTFNRGGMMKKRRFDVGGVLDYEIDPDSRRAHGLYDEAPKKAAAKAKPKPKPAIRRNSEDIAAENRDERNSSGIKEYLGPDERVQKILDDTRAQTKAADFKARASETNKRQQQLSEDRSNRKMYTFRKGGMLKYAEGGKMPMKGGKPAFIGDGIGMKKGGMPMKDGKPMFMKKMMGGGMSYAKGGGIESRGKTKGTMVRMASGGSVGSASRRADGIAQRGKTRI